jgi:hypothetical protein
VNSYGKRPLASSARLTLAVSPRGATTNKNSTMTEPRVYIHEFVDITGHNRAKYFQHISANWSPIGQNERNQRCFGIWGTVGSTGRWPEVINLWEYDGWQHVAENFRIEFSHPTLQDPSLADWWAAAEGFRRGGFDRLLVAADFSPSITELTSHGERGELYAHEIVTVPAGGSQAYLDLVAEYGLAAYGDSGAALIGAFRTALVDDREALLLWAFPDWGTWAEFEAASDADGSLATWRKRARKASESTWRFLMVDAPLSPLRTGRQPRESDRTGYPA